MAAKQDTQQSTAPTAPATSRDDQIEAWGRDLAQNIPALRETEAHNTFRNALDALKQQLK